MLKFLLILSIATAISARSFCQTNGKQVIKISGISMEQLITGLLNAGYSIEKSEASMSIIITHIKEVPKINIATQIKARIKEGMILLSGEYFESGKSEIASPINDAGVEGSPCKESWNLLHSLAQSFKKPIEIQ